MKTDRKKQRNKKSLILLLGAACVLAILLLIFVPKGIESIRKSNQEHAREKMIQQKKEEIARNKKIENTLAQAELLAAGYDYDGAIDVLEKLEETDDAAKQKLEEYQEIRASLQEADLTDISAFNVKTLIADTSVTWHLPEESRNKIADYNQGMLTVDEFRRILEEFYANDYVLVSLHNLEGSEEEGEEDDSSGKILLPEGKTPIIFFQEIDYTLEMSVSGFASKIVFDADGNPTCSYEKGETGESEEQEEDEEDTDEEDSENAEDLTALESGTGAYDVIPILEAFLAEHPDFSYHGARAVLTVSGEDGILGYRTDPMLAKTAADGNLAAETYGTFDTETETEEAMNAVDTLLALGYEFACGGISHTEDKDDVAGDYQEWQTATGNLLDTINTIAFPNGADLEEDGTSYEESESYLYLNKQGYNIFSSIRSGGDKVQFGNGSLRINRMNLDGYSLYREAIGKTSRFDGYFDAASVIDGLRPAYGLSSDEYDADETVGIASDVTEDGESYEEEDAGEAESESIGARDIV